MLKKNKNKFIFGVIAGSVICFLAVAALALFVAPEALAQVTIKQSIGQTLNLGTADLETTVIRIVQWVLGFLGLVAVIMIIYGGVIWMTAGGNDEKVAKAKKIITRAVIGLIIVLISWAIVALIMDRMGQFTGTGNPCNNGDWNGNCLLCVGGSWQYQWGADNCQIDPEGFVMNEVETTYGGLNQADDVYRCSHIKPKFNNRIDGDSIDLAVTAGTVAVYQDVGGPNEAQINGTWTNRSRSTTFKHPDLFEPNMPHQLRMSETVANANGMLLSDCIADPACIFNGAPNNWYEWNFDVGAQVDDIPPVLESAYPVLDTHANYPDRNVDRAPIISVVFNESIDDTTVIGPNDHPTAGTCSVSGNYCDEDNACGGGEECQENFELRQIDGQGGADVVGGPLDLNNDAVVDSDLLIVDNSISNGFRVYLENPFINPLDSFAWYRITVKDVEDMCANPMDPPPIDWEFQTNDNVPGVRTWFPRSDQECLDTTIGIVFNTSMYNHDVTFTITGDANLSIGPLRAVDMGDQINNADGQLFVRDPNIANPSNGYKFFEFVPNQALDANGTFNVSVTTNMVIDMDNNVLTQDWSFSTATPETCSCQPTITSVQNSQGSNQGMNGECITINGRCLRGVIGSDPANPVNPANPDIDFEFPVGTHTPANVEGGDLFGRQLVTTVPAIYSNGDWPDVTVGIDYVDDDYDPVPRSNAFGFFINSDDTANGPCLFSVRPSAGYPNINNVVFRGIRFDETSGVQDTHYRLLNDKVSTASTWTDTRAVSTVPNITNNGDYGINFVSVEKDGGMRSNELNFQIMPIPPDTPVVVDYWQTCTTACVNTAMGAIITEDVSATVNSNTAKLYQCADENCDAAGLTHINDTTAPIATWNGLPDPDELTTIDIFSNAGVLTANTYYRVVLTNAIQNTDGVALTPLNYDDTGDTVNDSFSWIFATKDDASICEVDHIDVWPPAATLAINQSRNYHGSAYGSPSQCDAGGEQLNPADYVWNWDLNIGLAQINPTANDWVVNVLARLSGDEQVEAAVPNPSPPPADLEDFGDLTIVDCETNEHCRENCSDPNSQSVCDPDTNTCTPWISNIAPQDGPVGQFVTIQGCYFGYDLGNVNFGGISGTFDCENAWSNTEIITTAPDLPINSYNLVDVQTADHYSTSAPNPMGSDQTAMRTIPPSGPPYYDYHVIDTCSGYCSDDYSYCDENANCDSNICLFEALDLNQGTPGICQLTPSYGKADDGSGNVGTRIIIDGLNLYHEDFNAGNDNVRYEGGAGVLLLDNIATGVIARGGSWTADEIRQTIPPLGTETGPVKVFANDCPSNPIDFYISCSVHGDCNTGCCKYDNNAGTKICQPAGECSTGEPGQPCQIPDDLGTPLPLDEANPNCANGPVDPPDPPGDYDCISDTGDTQSVPPDSNNPPNPPNPPPYGDDCRFCCEPGQVSAEGLTCVAEQGDCLSDAGYQNSRGLYCGCQNDTDCSAGLACGDDTCCYPNPTIVDIAPDHDTPDICRNQSFNIEFDQLMRHSTLNSDNLLLLWNIGNNECEDEEGEYEMPHAFLNDGSESSFDVLSWLKNSLIIKEAKAGLPSPLHDNWCRIPTRIRNRNLSLPNPHTETTIIPLDNMPEDEDIRLVIIGQSPTSEGVLSSQGIGLIDFMVEIDDLSFDFDEDTIMDSAVAEFDTGDLICEIDDVVIDIFKRDEDNNLVQFQSPDLFLCARDDCFDDMDDVAMAGNQHYYEAQAVDADGQPIGVGVTYNWQEVDPDTLVVVSDGVNPNEKIVNPEVIDPDNGTAYLQLEATHPQFGIINETARINVNICDNPWPNPFDPDYDDFPYEDALTHFGISYCRDRGGVLLPALRRPNQVIDSTYVVVSGDGRDDLVKQFFFMFALGGSPSADVDDAIGIRVYENEQGLSPESWYEEQFPGSPSPQSLEVDGYQAVRAGRTVYVAAPNITNCGDSLGNPVDCDDPMVDRGDRYDNIYLMSYNEGALPDTIAVYNDMLKNWQLNINLADDKRALQRDFKRVADLQDIYLKALEYKDFHGTFPRLEGGTFIQGMSNSKWPSWQETLGSAVSFELPVDPLNEFELPDDGGLCEEASGYDQNTCWKNTDPRGYQCPDQSHIYQYNVLGDGNVADLYANMEYTGPGRIGSGPVDPCNPDFPEAECHCFNYHFNATGTFSDHEGPTFNEIQADGVVIDENMCYVYDGIVDLRVDLTDLPDDGNASGVQRVEFFVNGIRRFTDDNSADGWTWSWDTTEVQDNTNHDLLFVAYDNNGNFSSTTRCVTADNSGSDIVSPAVAIITPDDQATVSGNVLVSAQASDNVALSSTELNFYDQSGNLVFSDAVCGVAPCDGYFSTIWDTTIVINNASYRIEAVVVDTSGNSTRTEIWVNVNNTDLGPPYNVVITTPVDGDGDNEADNPVVGVFQVNVDAEDDVAVDHVNFYIDNVLVDTDNSGPAPFTWNWDTLQYEDSIRRDPPALYNLMAVAYDAAGHYTSASMAVEVLNGVNDTTPPVLDPDDTDPDLVDPILPDSYTRYDEGDTFTISVDYIDLMNDLNPGVVNRVNFYQDYVHRFTDEDNTGPWTWGPIQADNWTTGCHTVLFDAEDTAGNISETSRIYIAIRDDCIPSGGPTISSWEFIPADRQVAVGETLTVRARVVDTDGVNQVEMRIKETDPANPPFYTTIMTETAPGSHIYEGSWPADRNGVFYVDLWANDDLGNETLQENI